MVLLVLNVGYEQFVRVNVLAYSQKLLAMQVHVGNVFVVMGQETSIGKDKLEAIVKESVLVQCQNEPCEGFIGRLDIFKLRIDVADGAIVAEILRYQVPIVTHALHISICVQAVKSSIVTRLIVIGRFRLDKAILEEVIQDDYQVPEELIYAFFADGLPSGFRRIASIAQ